MRTFQWCPQTFHLIPAMLLPDATLDPEQRLKRLFEIALGVLRRVSVSLALLLSRFERVEQGLVLAVNCPLECLRQFVLSQRRQDMILIKDARQRARAAAASSFTAPSVETTSQEQQPNDDTDNDDEYDDDIAAYVSGGSNFELSAGLAEEGKRLRAIWAASGTSLEMYRAFAYAIFRIRAQLDPPVFVLASLIDNDYIVVCCRHPKILMQDTYKKIPGCVRACERDCEPGERCTRSMADEQAGWNRASSLHGRFSSTPRSARCRSCSARTRRASATLAPTPIQRSLTARIAST